ncbi:MAG: CxxxxCH/CxxCH domain-containing protein [Ignavibacteriaceae bacterium]|nr:CxxxxCH/CxxCH domain-containing protein [Ignavibacteriaceae bacterium]
MKNIKIIYLLLIPVFAGFILSGCADIKEDVTGTSPVVNVHSSGILQKGSPDFHGNLIKNKEWDMKQCQKCHASDYKGGLTGASCLKCHTGTKGPESCNTCHGDFRNASKIAPPQDTEGNTSNTARGVGAHANHLYDNLSGNAVACNECHTVPTAVSDPGHIDKNVHLVFGDLAMKTSNNGAIVPNPTYDKTTLECSNVYCHGTFKNGNQSNKVKWTAGTDGAKCGTCHGDATSGNPLPPSPHPQVANCSTCHWMTTPGDLVTGSGAAAIIVNKTKHVNGKLNLFGQENDY